MIVRNRSMCAHEWFAVSGCTVCLHCGMDLEKALDVLRVNTAKIKANRVNVVKAYVKVTIPDRDQQADEEPYTPTLAESLATWPRWLVYALAAILGTAGGLIVAAVIGRCL